MATKAKGKKEQGDNIRIIKKYPNRRIYDTHESVYIKLDDIRNMVNSNIPFKVIDSKTEEDITRTILLQIITEQEANEDPLFSADNLKSFINFYEQDQSKLFSEFMTQSVQFFQHQQEQFNQGMQEMMNNNPVKMFSEYTQEYSQQNAEMWKKMQDTFFGGNDKQLVDLIFLLGKNSP